MKTKLMQTILAASVLVAGLTFMGGDASAGSRGHGNGHHNQYRHHGSSFQISFGGGGHHYAPQYSAGYSSGHHYRYRANRHVCRYETRPVSRYYYDHHGDRIYYTDYERVRVCRHRHGY